MKSYTIIKQSLKAILANKGRSFLTILGIVIGIGSVIALMSLGNGVKGYITGQINTLGPNNLTVTPGNEISQASSSSNSSAGSSPRAGIGGGGGGAFSASSTLTGKDLTSLADKTKNPDVDQASGNVNGTAISGNQRYQVIGTTTNLFQIRGRSIGSGQIFTDTDVQGKSNVADLGFDLGKTIFGTKDPIGESITIGNIKSLEFSNKLRNQVFKIQTISPIFPTPQLLSLSIPTNLIASQSQQKILTLWKKPKKRFRIHC